MTEPIEIIGSYWTLAVGAEPFGDQSCPHDFRTRVEVAARAGAGSLVILRHDDVDSSRRCGPTDGRRSGDPGAWRDAAGPVRVRAAGYRAAGQRRGPARRIPVRRQDLRAVSRACRVARGPIGSPRGAGHDRGALTISWGRAFWPRRRMSFEPRDDLRHILTDILVIVTVYAD